MLNDNDKRIIEAVVYAMSLANEGGGKTIPAVEMINTDTEPINEEDQEEEEPERPKVRKQRNSSDTGGVSKSQQIAELLNQGLAAKEIAEKIGCKIQTVYVIKSKIKHGIVTKRPKDIFDEPEDKKEVLRPRVSLGKYSDIKESVQHGMSAEEIAQHTGIIIEEINLVMRSKNYDHYYALK